VAPAARLVLARVLRRVIRIHADLHGFVLRIPHNKSYVIDVAPLLDIVDKSDLGIPETEELPPQLLLLEQPSTDELESWSKEESFLRIWRLLFHAKIHQILHSDGLQGPVATGAFTAERIASHIARLGPLVFAEIRTVLEQELFLLPPYDDATAYEEFVAVYLGIRKFNPYLLPSFFPAIERPDEVDAMMAEFIDVDALLKATRLPNTPDPRGLVEMPAAILDTYESGSMPALQESRETAAGRRTRPARSSTTSTSAKPRQRSESTYLLWKARADREEVRGNLAGAAIRRARAEYAVPRERAALAASALRDDIHALVERLQKAIGQQDRDPRPWREALLAMAHQTPRGIWTAEARTIYDLQKVCVDHEQVISTVDLMHWVFSWGRRPIIRQLPNQREVLMSRHLRSALARVPVLRIPERQRRQLAEVLVEACEEAETLLREQFRPQIGHALNHIELMPENVPERVAREKLVEELLDGIVERGFLTMGDLRDAVSRNNLKQPDCSGPVAFFHGNAVLRANRVLGAMLDGVYERGDFYLRWIQRFSMLAFGTRTGRVLTKYVAIPFGGAAIILKALEHFASLISGQKLVWAPEPGANKFDLAAWHPILPTLGLGVFLFGLLHFPAFRSTVWETLKGTYRALKFLLFDWPRWLLSQAWMQAFLQSKFARFLSQSGVKPLFVTLLAWHFLAEHKRASTSWWEPLLIFLPTTFAFNLRVVQRSEEVMVDAAKEAWNRVGVRFILGSFWFIIDLFRTVLQAIERVMYSVDEWLRFKTGQSTAMLAAKGALGVIWFFVAYFLRFTINLLVEPQLNPLKHVPVVTVGHKCIIPFTETLHDALMARGLSEWTAAPLTFVIISGTPGIFGFIAWEFKENWRLFAANRPKNLQPVMIGHHGETLGRLFKPGFYSGTIPKRFAKLRRAERKALASGDAQAARKHRQELHHLEESLRHWAQREFLQWFHDIAAWTLPAPTLGEIHLATNNTRMHFHFGKQAEVEFVVTFQVKDEKLEAELAGSLAPLALSPEAQRVLQLALTSLFKTGGVEAIVLAETAVIETGLGRLDSYGDTPISWSYWVEQWNAVQSAQSNVSSSAINNLPVPLPGMLSRSSS
jgi:hypothetical protein